MMYNRNAKKQAVTATLNWESKLFFDDKYL